MTRNFVGARGIESIFTTTTSSTTTAFPLYDCHGNMVATVARSGSGFVTSNVRTYDVWGGVRTGATTGGPKGRYVANLGHVQDDESGLIYMRARYYEPETGRFISEDPATDGSNCFFYANNDPMTLGDFSGQVATPIVIGFILWFASYLTNLIPDDHFFGKTVKILLKSLLQATAAVEFYIAMGSIEKRSGFYTAGMAIAGGIAAVMGAIALYQMLLLTMIVGGNSEYVDGDLGPTIMDQDWHPIFGF